MAIAYHTHTFSVPTADAADLLAGTASDKVITPDVLGPVTAAVCRFFSLPPLAI